MSALVKITTIPRSCVAKAQQTLLLLLAVVFVLQVFLLSARVEAGEMQQRSITVNRSGVDQSIEFEISFEYQTLVSTGSLLMQVCANSPLFDLPCTFPSGIDTTGVSLDAQSGGATGFTLDASTNGQLLLTRPGSVVGPALATYDFSGMVAPSDTGTYYIRISSFASSDGTGSSIDQSAIAFSLNNAINLSAFVPPRLEFCVAETISGFSCATAQGSLLNFGEFSTSQPSARTAQMVIATNSVTGFTIAMIGTTLTSGNNLIPAPTTAQSSLTGTSRFGVNLRANSAPSVGSNVQGPGTGEALAPYSTPNQFAFASGDAIARSVFSTDYNKFTMSYVATIGDDQPPGVYTTTMTYIATATF